MPKITDPIKIGTMEVKNRLVVAPTATNRATEDGYITERQIDRYEELARGGWGLIHVEATYMRQDTIIFPRMQGIWSTKHIPGLSEIAEIIHLNDVKCTLQIMHGGRQAVFGMRHHGFPSVAPSAITFWGVTPKELTIKQCEELRDLYVVCAERTKEAGFDGVLIHGSNGFLPQQFMSPDTNRRTDKYGDRMRWTTEMIEKMRATVGKDFSIIIRISADEFIGERGITLEMTQKEIVPALEAAGVDCIDVSAGTLETAHMIMPTGYQPRGCLMYLAEGVKKVAKVPVIGVGRINDPELAIKVIEEGKCDLVALARQSIADPHFPKKTFEGRYEDIRRCIACYTCLDRWSYLHLPHKCAINPEFGKEKKYRIVPTEKAKKVLIVGGGPAGMEAARVAALRGHEVTLYEKEDRLGGQLLLATVPPGKEEIGNLTEYLTTQIKKLDVKIELGKECTLGVIEEVRPDVVIIATGGDTFIPEIPGVDGDNVITALDVLAGKVEVGGKVIVLGGDRLGCETADFLVEKGKKVTITRRGEVMGASYGPALHPFILNRLKDRKVEMLPGVKYKEITDKGLTIVDKEGREKTIEADTIVLAVGLKPNRKLYKEIEGRVPELYMIGDCKKPREIFDAMHEAAYIARSI